MLWGNSCEEMFGNVSRLLRFGVYFEITLNRNMTIFMYKYILIIVARIILGGSAVQGNKLAPREILKIWCSLVRFGVYFDQIVF